MMDRAGVRIKREWGTVTERQKELRDLLRAHARVSEVQLTQKQMAAALETSTSSICWLLAKLEDLGEIEIGRGWRNVKVLEPRQREAA